MCSHNHNHGHDHSHHHHDAGSISGKKLLFTIIMNFIITLAEVIGGLLSGSLSLISDAMHNFTDGVALINSYIAIKLGQKNNSHKHTFGFKRAEVIAAFINAAVLVGISIFLFYEAVVRFIHPEPIAGKLMLIVAVIGLIANLIGVYLLESGSKESLNMKSAYLHMLTDAVASVAVIIGAIAIIYLDVYWVDPLLTIFIGLYVLKESFHILKSSVHILMEGAPVEISLEEVYTKLNEISLIENAHHLHMWAVGEKDIFFEGHIKTGDITLSETRPIYDKIKHILEHYGVNHITLQFESEECCPNDMLCAGIGK